MKQIFGQNLWKNNLGAQSLKKNLWKHLNKVFEASLITSLNNTFRGSQIWTRWCGVPGRVEATESKYLRRSNFFKPGLVSILSLSIRSPTIKRSSEVKWSEVKWIDFYHALRQLRQMLKASDDSFWTSVWKPEIRFGMQLEACMRSQRRACSL